MVSSFSCGIVVFDLCYPFALQMFAELVLSEQSGTQGDEVDLYEVVPRNEELQREQNISFGQLEVCK